MEILDIKVLRGPNYWSNFRKKLIVFKIHLGDYEHLPSNLIDGFTERLKILLPSMQTHRCSVGVEGGFFQRLESGTWMGHVLEHIALELQWLAGMRCGFGRTRSTLIAGIYNVVFSYEVEQAGIYAGKVGIEIIKCLANNKPYDLLADDIAELKRMYEREKFGPSTEAIVREAEKRNIPYHRLNNRSLIRLGQGCHQKLICSTTACTTSNIAVELVADKNYTKEVLKSALIPTPKGIIIDSLDDLPDVIAEIDFPLVIKPLKGNHGKGVTTNIHNLERAVTAFKLAKKMSEDVLVEKFVQGFDYRLLVVNYKLVAVAKRTPAMIIGTGEYSIKELIEEINKDNKRGNDHENFLTKINIDEVTLSILEEKSLTLDVILPKGEALYLKNAANISTGGTATDVTDFVHLDNIVLAERIARLVNLDICGIDVIAEDIALPITEKHGVVIEVNAGPGLRMHLSPTHGNGRNVAEPIIEMLYPNNKSSRIPIVAVTGTNGKTTTARLIAHFARYSGFNVGLTTTDGIYINQQEIRKGDCSGPLSAQVVLHDPSVNYAVLECARGGIIRSGLGFDQCDISVVTNITEDHLGQNDIFTMDELVRVKSVVPRSTSKNGYAVLNADDDLVYSIKDDIHCQIALFSMSHDNPRIAQHCKAGGFATFIDNNFIVLQQGENHHQVARINEIPLSFLGKSKSNIQNILGSVLAGVLSNFTLQDIEQSLKLFYPSIEHTPGRMNLFNFDRFNVLVDYAHNVGAYIRLKEFIDQLECTKKVGIVAATGDRLPSDIKKIGYYSAQIYDEIIIRHDKDGRGKTNQELTELILEGIKHFDATANQKVKVISNEFEAIQYAMDNAEPGTFILYFPDEIHKGVNYVQEAHQNLMTPNSSFKRQPV